MDSLESSLITRTFTDDGRFPNNGNLPLIIHKGAFPPDSAPERYERRFAANLWPAAWRNGLYDMHHYHSTSHEALGIYRGRVSVRFGGPGGETVEARAGDVIIIPAGVSHCNEGQSGDFRVVGAYPEGCVWDMCYGRAEERARTLANIRAVAVPPSDPVFGVAGPLVELWTQA